MAKIKCFKITNGDGGPGLIGPVKSYADLLSLCFGDDPTQYVEVGEHFTLEVIEMEEDEIEALPEWDGW